MQWLRLLCAVAVLGAGNVLCAPAWALFDTEGLNPSYCQQPTVRSTVVYIDDMMMVERHTDWALNLATKLRATLTPGERVTVVRLSPADGQSREYWSGCWPDYPAAKRAQLAQETYILRENPVDAIADQKKYFLRDFGAALTKIYLAAKRPADQVRIAADNPPNKQILRALASDEGRFADATKTIRAIIYSDLAENSDLGSAFHPPSGPLSYGQQLGSYLRRGIFYDYGLGEDVHGDPAFQEQARMFWTAALRSMAATVAGLGTDLNVPNTLPVNAYSWPMTLNFNGQTLDGRLSLLAGEGGHLVDSTLGISRLGSAALNGTFRCEGSSNCRLEAETMGGIATNAPTESVRLRGSAAALSGRLGVPGQGTSFALRTGEPAD